jgi:hypothetical protein
MLSKMSKLSKPDTLTLGDHIPTFNNQEWMSRNQVCGLFDDVDKGMMSHGEQTRNR